MYLPDLARRTPDKPAMVTDTGQVVTYAELEARANRLSRLLYARGLRRGDHLTLLMENNIRFMDVVWAAYRSGLYFTTINRHSNVEEAAYLARDSGTKAIVSSFAQRELAAALQTHS